MLVTGYFKSVYCTTVTHYYWMKCVTLCWPDILSIVFNTTVRSANVIIFLSSHSSRQNVFEIELMYTICERCYMHCRSPMNSISISPCQTRLYMRFTISAQTVKTRRTCSLIMRMSLADTCIEESHGSGPDQCHLPLRRWIPTKISGPVINIKRDTLKGIDLTRSHL